MLNQTRTGVCGDGHGYVTAEGPVADLAAVLAPSFLVPLRADGHDALCPLASQTRHAVLALDRAGGLIRAVGSDRWKRAAVAWRERAGPGPAPAGGHAGPAGLAPGYADHREELLPVLPVWRWRRT